MTVSWSVVTVSSGVDLKIGLLDPKIGPEKHFQIIQKTFEPHPLSPVRSCPKSGPHPP